MPSERYSMKQALVLLSGGQDSTTCLYWALSKFDKVYACGFDYGQTHVKEIEQAKHIANSVGVDYKIFKVRDLLTPSPLTASGNHSETNNTNKDLPAVFTAGRNILFLSIAASYATTINVADIVTGVCQTDYSGFPDCRRTTIDAMQLVLSLGYGAGDYRIHTPLMYLSKAETWRMAKELNCIDVIINDTLTDYNGDTTLNEWGMGTNNNPATALRVKGYYEAKQNGWI
jgi:7-cyano-7-deazaguanine synthase